MHELLVGCVEPLSWFANIGYNAKRVQVINALEMTVEETVGQLPTTVDNRADGSDNGSAPEVAVSIRNLYKVFGDDSQVEQALEMSRDGKSKAEVQEETGAVIGINNVSLEISKGEMFVVMGLSGCGKSTLIRCINRLIDASAGEIWLDDRDMLALDETELREVRRHEMSMVFQHYGLLPHRTVAGNVGFGLELMGVEPHIRRERVQRTLDTVGLSGWGDSMADELSGGMKQRVGLARALALDAPILLMDEPFSALDPLIRGDLQEELLQLQQAVQKTVVFITHDLNEAVKVGDRVAIMRDGMIAQVGAPTEIVLEPADHFVADFVREVRQNALITAESVMTEVEHSINHTVNARQAHRLFVENDWHFALIVDDEMRYVGTLTLQRIDAEWEDAQTKPVGELRLRNEETVGLESVLDDLVPVGLRAEHPVPVCNEEGTLVGEVKLEVLARALD